MVSVSQLTAGAMKFIDTEMLPALPVNQRWIAGVVVFAAQRKAEKIIGKLAEHPVVNTLELIDGNGMVDMELVKAAVKSVCQKHGALEIPVPMLGQFKMTEKNFDVLFKHIKAEAAGNESE